MSHTPGPWEWREGVLYPAGDSPNLHSIINDGGCSVHRIASIEKWVPERDANHRLIAAAPDLLAALKRMVATFADAEAINATSAIEQAQAAIARAES